LIVLQESVVAPRQKRLELAIEKGTGLAAENRVLAIEKGTTWDAGMLNWVELT
jgi:hypothetical protein